MSGEATPFQIEQDADERPVSAADRLMWPLLLLTAWLAFELTANATLSLVLACLKFGWNDFRTAWWLWRIDPHRARARSCAAFYFASGNWKTAIVPLLVAAIVSVIWALYTPNAMAPQHPVTVQLRKAMLVGGCAAGMLICSAGVAIALAIGAKWRVWVHHDLHVSRRQDNWPPKFLPDTTARDNMARPIVMTSFVALILVGPVATLSILSHVPMPPIVQPLFSLAVVFGFPIFTVVALSFLRNNLFAESPWECWPESLRQLETSRNLIAGDRHDPPANAQ